MGVNERERWKIKGNEGGNTKDQNGLPEPATSHNSTSETVPVTLKTSD